VSAMSAAFDLYTYKMTQSRYSFNISTKQDTRQNQMKQDSEKESRLQQALRPRFLMTTITTMMTTMKIPKRCIEDFIVMFSTNVIVRSASHSDVRNRCGLRDDVGVFLGNACFMYSH